VQFTELFVWDDSLYRCVPELTVSVLSECVWYELGRSHTIGPLARWINLAANWQQIAPIVPFLPTMPTRKHHAVYNLRFRAHHGMEEVIGSIPIRSTK
jgi:hypothetical protein